MKWRTSYELGVLFPLAGELWGLLASLIQCWPEKLKMLVRIWSIHWMVRNLAILWFQRSYFSIRINCRPSSCNISITWRTWHLSASIRVCWMVHRVWVSRTRSWDVSSIKVVSATSEARFNHTCHSNWAYRALDPKIWSADGCIMEFRECSWAL